MIATINPGALNQRLTLQQPAASLNGLGETAGSWTDVATVWGQAQPLRGREFLAAAQLQSTLDVRFRIRYRADVRATWRVLWQGEAHEIVGEPINVDGAGVLLELMCTKGIRDGRA